MTNHKKDRLWLYTFTVNKEIEIAKEEDTEINGEKVKVTRQVKEKKPVTFALKRPNRKMYEEADLFYGVKLSDGVRAGLLTKPLLLKRYRNDGGALSDVDTQYFSELTARLTALEEEHQRVIINIDKLGEEEKMKKAEEIINKKMAVLKSLQTLESVNQAIFAHTAESRAQTQLNNWWLVHLAYWFENDGDEPKEFFPGVTYDEKMGHFDVIEEEKTPYIIEAVARFSLLVGLWISGAQTPEDFLQGEKDYGTLTVEAKKEESVPEVNA